MNKCFCDKCGKEIKGKSDKKTINFLNNTGHLSFEPYEVKDVCYTCSKLVLAFIERKEQ